MGSGSPRWPVPRSEDSSPECFTCSHEAPDYVTKGNYGVLSSEKKLQSFQNPCIQKSHQQIMGKLSPNGAMQTQAIYDT